MKYTACVSTDSTFNTSEWYSIYSARKYIRDYIEEGVSKGEPCTWSIFSADERIDNGTGRGGSRRLCRA